MSALLTLAAALVGLVVLTVTNATPAWAHHGTAMYDFSGDVILHGEVAKYTFESPHIWLTLKAPGADGKMADWSLEGPPPLYAVNRGWARDSLKPGQKVTVAVAPRKDARNAGLIITIAEPGGKVLLERGRRY